MRSSRKTLGTLLIEAKEVRGEIITQQGEFRIRHCTFVGLSGRDCPEKMLSAVK